MRQQEVRRSWDPLTVVCISSLVLVVMLSGILDGSAGTGEGQCGEISNLRLAGIACLILLSLVFLGTWLVMMFGKGDK